MPSFDRERFEALILYIVWRTYKDRQFGRVKLAKTLFYSDFESYFETGQPLTGATYIGLAQGPFPEQLAEAEQSLRKRKLIRLEYDKDEYETKRIVPLGEPPYAEDIFQRAQLIKVVEWIAKLQKGTARAVSDESHKHPGWRIAGTEGNVIPYETAFLPQGPPTAEAVERAITRGREEGLLSDDGWIWERQGSAGQ